MNKKLLYQFKWFKDNKKRKALKHFSGFNTLGPYSNNSDKNINRSTKYSKGALINILENLIAYLEDLTAILPDSANHDLYLKGKLDIIKIEMLPTLPDYFKCDFEFTKGKLNFIYKLTGSIYEDFIILQDLFHTSGEISNYKPLLKLEKEIIKTLLDSLELFLFYNIDDKKLSVQYLEQYLEFDKSLQKISKKQNRSPWDRTIERITDHLNHINESNERIYRRMISLTEAGIKSKQKKKLNKHIKYGVAV